MTKVHFRTTLVDGKPKGPRELFVDGLKICDMTEFEILDLIIDATMAVKDKNGKAPMA